MNELSEILPVLRPYAIAERAAMECWQEVGGDLRAAENLLSKRLDSDEDLSGAITFLGVREAVRKAVHNNRTNISRISMSPNDDNVEGLYHLAHKGMREFLDFPLPGGGRLGDADKDLLDAARLVFQRNAHGSYINELWLGLIGKKLHKGKIVSDQFDQKQLLKLKKQAENESDRF